MEAANEIKTPRGEKAEEERKLELQKSVYYYTQALLVFYYLIPENEEEEKESDGLKFDCHLQHAEVLRQSTRYLDALSEIQIIENMPDNKKYRSEKLPTVKALKAWVNLHLQRYDEALESLSECKEGCECECDGRNPHKELREQIKRAKVDHSIQEKALYRKMLHSKKSPRQQTYEYRSSERFGDHVTERLNEITAFDTEDSNQAH